MGVGERSSTRAATRITGASMVKSSVRAAARPASPIVHRLSTEEAIRRSSRPLSLRTSWKTKSAAGEARPCAACGSPCGAAGASAVPCASVSGGLAAGCGSGLRRRRPPLASALGAEEEGKPGAVLVLERCEVSRLQCAHQTIMLPSLSSGAPEGNVYERSPQVMQSTCGAWLPLGGSWRSGLAAVSGARGRPPSRPSSARTVRVDVFIEGGDPGSEPTLGRPAGYRNQALAAAAWGPNLPRASTQTPSTTSGPPTQVFQPGSSSPSASDSPAVTKGWK